MWAWETAPTCALSTVVEGCFLGPAGSEGTRSKRLELVREWSLGATAAPCAGPPMDPVLLPLDTCEHFWLLNIWDGSFQDATPGEVNMLILGHPSLFATR